MKRFFTYLLVLFIGTTLFSQEQQLAYQYFMSGEYDKAATIYKELHEKNSYNSSYLSYLVDCYQELEKWQKATDVINKHLVKYPYQKQFLVDLGYNFQLQHKQKEANLYYEKALEAILDKKYNSYSIAKTFQDNFLLNYALKAYKKAMEINPKANYNYQIATIYAEQGKIVKMFEVYLTLVERNNGYYNVVKNNIGKFITEDNENKNNLILKKLLLKRSQNNPKNSWNLLLSWLYIQQKEYKKALIQEKALHKRNDGDLKNIVALGKIAFEDKDFNTSKNCFNYVLESKPNKSLEIKSKMYLLEIELKTNTNYKEIESQFSTLFKEYGKNETTIDLQLIYAEFLAFKKVETKKATTFLQETLKLSLNKYNKGKTKIKLADILIYNGKFNSALIYYTQVQNDLKNHPIGQLAQYKTALASYFKGDFDWAQSQLKILKKATSQLIANDALHLHLLILDNTKEDSLKIALKKYAKADLLAHQNKNKQALDSLNIILNRYKNHPITDEALYKQAKLFEKTKQFTKAENNYLKIIALNKEDILADDANYYLAELYSNKLNQLEKAKQYYKKIIFNYPSSIYLVDARKKYRKLRGDTIK